MGRVRLLFTMLLFSTSCGGDGKTTDDGSSSSNTEASSSAESSSGEVESGETGNGQLPPNCGWNGSSYTCQWMGGDPSGEPIECPAEMMEGESCSVLDDVPSCCDAEGDAWTCVCEGDDCTHQWTVLDCKHSAGGGACGWWAEAGHYMCGGEGEDPNGTPTGCEPGYGMGVACASSEDLPCCDFNGDAWQCLYDEVEGGWVWAVVDC